jgi:hypothetical protein
MFGRTVTNLPEELWFFLFSIGGLPLRVFLGFFARSSYRFRRSLKPRLLASQIAAKLLLGSEDRQPDRRKLPFQCARDLGVTQLFVVAQHERHLLFSVHQLFPHFELFFPAQNLGER